jgi:DinB family
LSETSLLETVLDSWDRNNTILVNLLRTVPEGRLEAKATQDGPSVAQMFTHMHYVRLVFISEDARDLARGLPGKEWIAESNLNRIAQMLNEVPRRCESWFRTESRAGET